MPYLALKLTSLVNRVKFVALPFRHINYLPSTTHGIIETNPNESNMRSIVRLKAFLCLETISLKNVIFFVSGSEWNVLTWSLT